MRFKALLIILTLLPHLLIGAQSADYPTLDALSELDVPYYSYADMIRRISDVDISFTPPSSPPDYQIGDQESFYLPTDDSYEQDSQTLELRAMTDQVLIWVQDSALYSPTRAQRLAEHVENQIMRPLQDLFQYQEPPGVDGDPRLTIAMILAPDLSAPGFFPPWHAIPRKLSDESNQREMLVVNLNYDDLYDNYDQYLAEIIAHEYQHILLHHRDDNEDLWLDEAFSNYAEHYTSGPGHGFDGVYQHSDAFLVLPSTPLVNWEAGLEPFPKYGAGALFLIYLAENFGEEVITRLHAESADGWRAVDKVMREYADLSADEVFANWALANYFLAADRGHGYPTTDSLLTSPEPRAILRSYPATYSGSLKQYSSDYLAFVDLQGADKLSLRLTQAPEARLLYNPPFEGDHFYYAVAEATSNPKLTREIDLRSASRAELEFRLSFELEPHLEFAYVEVSTDGGDEWWLLSGRHTVDESRYGRFYDDGYTGNSGGWLRERISLSRYVGRRILLRFETYSNTRTKYRGLAIDDLRIDAIDYQDGFESPDDAWIADGWIRTDNRLPNNTWLQVVQDTGDSLHVSRALLSGPGDLTVDILPGVSQALVAISPVTPVTSLPTDYTLEANLLDADGNVMDFSRHCSVTTRAGLNFRASPNGNKIGVVPEGATFNALDWQGDWVMVEYAGKTGWISASYVTQTGTCP